MGEWAKYMGKTASDLPRSPTTLDKSASIESVLEGATKYAPLLDDVAILAMREANKPKKSKVKKASHEDTFRPLLAYLRALYQLHQFMHWQSKGAQFYGDHLLFQRLYEKAGAELDELAEKSIGIGGDSAIDMQDDADGTANILKNFQRTPEGALNAEKGFISLISTTREGLGDKLSDGLDNLLQELADTHEGHVYLLQQRTGGEKMDATKTSGIISELAGAARGVVDDAAGSVGHAADRVVSNDRKRVAALAGATGLLGGTAGYGIGLSQGLREKKAALDQVLGRLYTEYGPALQKHAAVRFYSSLDKDRLAGEALGPAFCKLARASQVDPWALAVRVVKSYPSIVKAASSSGSKEQELAQFYVDWSDKLLKKANVLTSIGNVASKAKAVGGAIVGPQGALRSTKHLATQGIAAGERGGVGQQVGKALHRQNLLQEAGGGSIARGKSLQQQALAERGMKQELMGKGWTPPVRSAQGAVQPAAQAAVKKPSGLGNYLRGAAVLGGLGLGGAAMVGGEPSYGEEAYA